MQWRELFAPVGWSIREGQESLGNAVIQTVSQNGILVGQASTGTGKSMAMLVPIINAVKSAPAGRPVRAVVATETIALQKQLVLKDLPLLHKVYGGFSYKLLMGRSNYFCLSHARESSKGNISLSVMVSDLESRLDSLGAGEKGDVENILGRPVDKDLWSQISGNTEFCSTNDCDSETCFSSKARAEALQADIVVANHRILMLDYDMKSSNMLTSASDGMLGPLSIIGIDEAHTLAESLSDHWTERYSDWEVNDHLSRVQAGLTSAFHHNPDEDYRDRFSDATGAILGHLETTRKFFTEIEQKKGNDWDRSENPFCMQYVTDPSDKLRDLMNEFETVGPTVFPALRSVCEDINKYLTKSLEIMMSEKALSGDKKAVRKASSSCKWLINACYLLGKAMESQDGIISQGGMTWGAVIEGWTRKNGDPGMTIRVVPIDVSSRASSIWSQAKSTIFLSATLEDLTSGDFSFFKKSLGIPNAREIRVESPFAKSQQLVYITPKPFPKEEGTVFSVEEIVESVNATNGRALILFTSRKDIQLAEQMLLQYKVGGRFPYTMLVQTPDADKDKLVKEFKEDTYSVLLGLKSFFTGVDIPGESLSNVIIARFPLSRYSAECKMKIKYWRSQGFPNWYSRDSLTVFQQAAGRLIRSDQCVGVVSILDQRVFEYGTNVYKTASTGVGALGSRVTHDLQEVTRHLEGSLNAVL